MLFTVSGQTGAGRPGGAERHPGAAQYLTRYLSQERGRVLLNNLQRRRAAAVSVPAARTWASSAARWSCRWKLETRIARVQKSSAASGRRCARSVAHHRQAETVRPRSAWIWRSSSPLSAPPSREIERAEAADVRKYLQLFRLDTLKAWAEQGRARRQPAGAAVAGRSSNHQRKRAAGHGHPGPPELGPADTRVVGRSIPEVRWPGIFASGRSAPGSSCSSTFVGGLFTLAAPIIAVLVHMAAIGPDQAQARGKPRRRAPRRRRHPAALPADRP